MFPICLSVIHMKKNDTSNALPEGRILNGRYRIWQKLGGGGFGLTYLATVRDAPVQGGLVVIKEHFPLWCATRDAASGAVCINVGEESRYEWSLDSFKHEAQQLSILNHINIIRVTDAFEENNTAYYVMPYVRGGSLADGVKWLRRHEQKLSQTAVLKLMRTLLSALEHMHHSTLRGVPVYHLDIKPGNILLSGNGVEALAVLIDFGSPEMGSPGFMPHEQRNPQEIGPWTDIYALAASIHKLLTGKAPASHYDKNCVALTTPPRRPLLAQNKELLACYDIELLESIDRALSWDPAERFSDAAQWLRILDSIPLRWPDHGVDLHRLMMNIRTNEPVAPAGLWDTGKKTRSRQEWLRNLAIFLATAGVASFIGLALLSGGNDDTYLPEEEQSTEQIDILREKEEAERKRKEEEAARLKAEEEARIQREKEEAEAAQKKAEEEARIQREKEEAEAARKKAEEETRLQREKKAAEDKKKEEAARKKKEEEAARKKREKEQEEKRKQEAERQRRERAQAEEKARKQKEAQKKTSHVCPSSPQSARPGRPAYLKLQEGASIGCPNCTYWLRAINNR